MNRRPGLRCARRVALPAAAPQIRATPMPGPADLLDDMIFWLRGDSVVESGGLITQATDLSGSGEHFSNAGGSASPTLANVAAANNQPGMAFDGVANRLDNAGITRPAPGTEATWFWAVVVVESWSTGELLFNAIGANTMQILPSAVSPGIAMKNPTTVNANTALGTFPKAARFAWEFTNTIGDFLQILGTVAMGSNAGNNSTTGIRIAVNNGATVFYPMTLLELICCPGFPGVDAVAQLDYYGSQRYGATLFS